MYFELASWDTYWPIRNCLLRQFSWMRVLASKRELHGLKRRNEISVKNVEQIPNPDLMCLEALRRLNSSNTRTSYSLLLQMTGSRRFLIIHKGTRSLPLLKTCASIGTSRESIRPKRSRLRLTRRQAILSLKSQTRRLIRSRSSTLMRSYQATRTRQAKTSIVLYLTRSNRFMR